MKHEARKTKTKAMKVNSFIKKWIANGEYQLPCWKLQKKDKRTLIFRLFRLGVVHDKDVWYILDKLSFKLPHSAI